MNRTNLIKFLSTVGILGLFSGFIFFSAVPAQGETTERYIVQYVDSANIAEEDDDRENRKVKTVNKVDKVFKGAIVDMTATQADELKKNKRVLYIEKDGIVTASAITTQSPATWGLDRIDQKTLPLNNIYNYEPNGQGVTAYVVDTGILSTHVEFGIRVKTGFTAITTGGTTDCNGHGTHVAGTIGGSTYGVAKSVNLVPVRVLDCNGSGTNSGVISGINWAVNQYLANPTPSVMNLSLGGGASAALDTAITSAVNAGITVVVAAGNSNANACNYSPARAPAAITVGATDNKDVLANFSNTGSCVDISAPGVSITSAWIGSSNSATNTISGTSMASPHVAGAAALALSELAIANASLAPVNVQNTLNSYSSNFITTRSSTSTRLLNTSVAGSTPAPVLTAPSAPRNVSASAGRSNGSLSITWQAPSAPGSGVTSYTARAYIAATGGSPIQSCSATSTSCTISNLVRRTNYYVDVTATGPGGTSLASTPRILRTTN